MLRNQQLEQQLSQVLPLSCVKNKERAREAITKLYEHLRMVADQTRKETSIHTDKYINLVYTIYTMISESPLRHFLTALAQDDEMAIRLPAKVLTCGVHVDTEVELMNEILKRATTPFNRPAQLLCDLKADTNYRALQTQWLKAVNDLKIPQLQPV